MQRAHSVISTSIDTAAITPAHNGWDDWKTEWEKDLDALGHWLGDGLVNLGNGVASLVNAGLEGLHQLGEAVGQGIDQLWHNTDDYIHNAYTFSFGNADELGRVAGSLSLAGIIGDQVIPPSPVITRTNLEFHTGSNGLTLTFEQPTGISTLVDAGVHTLLAPIPPLGFVYDALPDYKDGFGINAQVHSDGADVRLYEVVGHAGANNVLDYSDSFEAGVNLHVAWNDNPLLGRVLSGEHLGFLDSIKFATSLAGFHFDLGNSSASLYGVASNSHQGLLTHSENVLSYTHTLDNPAVLIGKLGDFLNNDEVKKLFHLPDFGHLFGEHGNPADPAATIGIPQLDHAADVQLA